MATKCKLANENFAVEDAQLTALRRTFVDGAFVKVPKLSPQRERGTRQLTHLKAHRSEMGGGRMGAGFDGAVRFLGPPLWAYGPKKPSPRPPPEAGALGRGFWVRMPIGGKLCRDALKVI